MSKFEHGTRGLLCPWCPPVKGVPVYINNCGHNPFELMRKNRELENQISRLERAERFLDDLKDLLREM